MALADRQQFGDIRRHAARATGQRQQQLLADSAGRADGRAGRHSRLMMLSRAPAPVLARARVVAHSRAPPARAAGHAPVGHGPLGQLNGERSDGV